MNEATKNKAYAARPQSELKRALVLLLALSLLLTACGKKQGGGEGGTGGNGSGSGKNGLLKSDKGNKAALR